MGNGEFADLTFSLHGQTQLSTCARTFLSLAIQADSPKLFLLWQQLFQTFQKYDLKGPIAKILSRSNTTMLINASKAKQCASIFGFLLCTGTHLEIRFPTHLVPARQFVLGMTIRAM